MTSTKGKNKDEIKVIEKRVASELDAFRTEKFMYFLFINALWIIISSIVLMYTGLFCTRPFSFYFKSLNRKSSGYRNPNS